MLVKRVLESFHPFFTSRLTFQTLAVSLLFGVVVLGLGWLFLLAGHSIQNDFTHAETLSHVFKPLVELPDRHLLASAVGLTLALITGRTDLCSAGVFV